MYIYMYTYIYPYSVKLSNNTNHTDAMMISRRVVVFVGTLQKVPDACEFRVVVTRFDNFFVMIQKLITFFANCMTLTSHPMTLVYSKSSLF